jgi:hypothetical protein
VFILQCQKYKTTAKFSLKEQIQASFQTFSGVSSVTSVHYTVTVSYWLLYMNQVPGYCYLYVRQIKQTFTLPQNKLPLSYVTIQENIDFVFIWKELGLWKYTYNFKSTFLLVTKKNRSMWQYLVWCGEMNYNIL